MLSFLRQYKFTILWTSIVFVLSLRKGSDLPQIALFQFDKLIHFVFYAVYAVIMLKERIPQYLFLSSRSWSIFTFLATFSIGLLIEVLQGCCIEGRVFDWMDVLANSLGGLFGLWLGWRLYR